MPSFAQILAPLVLLLPGLAAVEPPRDGHPAISPLQPMAAEQVSIEQRVTVRIGPRPAPMPVDTMMFDTEPEAGQSPAFVERRIGKCLPIAAIAGVQPLSNAKLLLILHDRRMITAKLEKGCQGRQFYSGFIVSRSSDGQICTGRDALLSRSGTSCQVTGFSQLVEVGG
jgi:hypothetical protein